MSYKEYNDIDVLTLISETQINASQADAEEVLLRATSSEDDMLKASIVRCLKYQNDGDYASAKKFLDKVYPLLLDDHNKAVCLLHYLRLAYNQDKIEEAYEYYKDSLDLQIENSAPVKSILLRNAGIIEDDLGKYILASQSFLKCYDLDKKYGRSVVPALINLGSVNLNLKNYENCIRIFSEAKELAEAENDTALLSPICCNLSITYYSLEKYKKAIKYADKALFYKKDSVKLYDENLFNITQVKIRCYDELKNKDSLVDPITEILKEDAFNALKKGSKIYYLHLLSYISFVIEKYNFKDLKKILYNRIGEERTTEAIFKETIEEVNKAECLDYLELVLYDYAYYNKFKKNFKKACELFIEREEIMHKTTYIGNTNINKQFQQLIQNQKEEQEKIKREAIIQQKIKSNELLKKFIQIIAHDLKQPIRNLSSYAFLWPELKDEEEKDFLKVIVDYTSIIQEIIDNILELGDQIEFTNEKETDLNEVLDFVKKSLNPLIEETKTTISSKNLPTVVVNYNLLKQVLYNIVQNSIKYSKPNVSPIIEISSEIKSDMLFISIKDNGIGIALENQNKIFDWNYSVDKEDVSNHGIGLAFSKKMLKLVNGDIYVNSIFNEGSTFTIELPIVKT